MLMGTAFRAGSPQRGQGKRLVAGAVSPGARLLWRNCRGTVRRAATGRHAGADNRGDGRRVEEMGAMRREQRVLVDGGREDGVWR